jgi:hypothetical protein|tara:strand:- start:9401 stop:10627 length:1227 start_codon:yes stop_codon:yes gene_type:complete
MPFRKFKQEDLIKNTLVTNPKVNFFIYDTDVYYNNRPDQDGKFSKVYSSEVGSINLYEYNIDKLKDSNDFIHPFVTKQSAGSGFKTTTATAYSGDFVYGDTMTGSYPMTASISRELMVNPSQRSTETVPDTGVTFAGSPTHRHFFALKNRLNFLGTRSPHYFVSSSFGNKESQTLNVIYIPSIAYGSRINPGSMSLKWFLTGSLLGELQDIKQNGELIQVGPVGSTGSGSVAGVVMYDEGIVLLTGSWALSSEEINLKANSSNVNPQWVYYGAGAKDGITKSNVSASFTSASFDMSFEGHMETQVLTMFAHAGRGEVNFSNNPTYITHNQTKIRNTSSYMYEENPDRTIKNTVSSSFESHQAPFERQVYVSKIAVYDENKNLIGVASLASPVLKKEDKDLTFKIKLDI